MDQSDRQGDDRSFDDIIRFVAVSAKNMHAFPNAFSKTPVEANLKALHGAVRCIGAKISRRPPPLERYLLQWRQFASGERTDLDKGTIRYLCWESNIATSPLFLEYLQWSESALGRRSLEGLVRSCHNRWEGDLVGSGAAAMVGTFIEKYRGPNEVLRRWRSGLDAVLGANGPALLARDMVLKGQRLESYLNQWYLTLRSPFVTQIVKEATIECRKRLGSGAESLFTLLFTDLLPWPYWKLHDLKEELGHLILHAATSGRIEESLLFFALRHRELGDPRLEQNRMNWEEVNPKARSRFIEGLKNNGSPVVFDQVYRYGEGWTWQLRERNQPRLG